jgi:hypothetical protein
MLPQLLYEEVAKGKGIVTMTSPRPGPEAGAMPELSDENKSRCRHRDTHGSRLSGVEVTNP